MKETLRASPMAARHVRSLLSLMGTFAFAAAGFAGDAPILLAVLFGLGLLFTGAPLVLQQGHLVIGDDGVASRWFGRRTFVPRQALLTALCTKTTGLVLEEKSGKRREFNVADRAMAAAHRRLDELLKLRDESPAPEGADAALRAARDEDLAARAVAWANGHEASPVAGGAYRVAEREALAWSVVEDAGAPPLARVGAALELGALDDAGRERMRAVADASAHPVVAQVTGDLARGVAPGRGEIRRELARPRARAEGGPGVVRLCQPLLALAFLSRAWPLTLAAAVAWPSTATVIVAALGAAIGAFPWVAAREMDPLARTEPGRVSAEAGWVLLDGRRVLELAKVKTVVMHWRKGAPAVVRFEGRAGWPLLDVRLEDDDATRAFFRDLPLTEAQRTPTFGSFVPAVRAHAGRVFAVAAVVAAALVWLLGAGVPQAAIFAAPLVLPLIVLRLRRRIVVRRDGVAFHTFGRTRVIPYDEVAGVERRAVAGVLVLRDGSRVNLRSLSKEPTTTPDDDLTEAIIDVLAAHRGRRARVAVEDARARVSVGSEPDAEVEGAEAEVTEEEEREGRVARG